MWLWFNVIVAALCAWRMFEVEEFPRWAQSVKAALANSTNVTAEVRLSIHTDDAKHKGNGGNNGGNFLILPDEYINFDKTICQGHENFTTPKPRVEDPVYYVSGKFRVGSRRWNDPLTRLGCRVLLSEAIPPDRIRIARDEFPKSILNSGRYERHMQFVRNATHESGRGAGYWFWKPLLNLALLQDDSVPDGAYVVYADGDRPDVIGFAGEVIEAMALRGHDFAIQQQKLEHAYHRTKGDTFVHFGFSNSSFEEWDDNRQYAANFFVYRKSAEILRFFTEWARLMEDYHQVSDEPSIVANHPRYAEHRHDQTMVDMLIKYAYNDGMPRKERLPIDMSGRSHIGPYMWSWLTGLRTFTLSLENTALPNFQHGPYRNEAAETTKKIAFRKEPFDMTWDEMTESAQEAASFLGYDQSSWDGGAYVPAYATPFKDLTEFKKKAALYLELEYNFYYAEVPEKYVAEVRTSWRNHLSKQGRSIARQ